MIYFLSVLCALMLSREWIIPSAATNDAMLLSSQSLHHHHRSYSYSYYNNESLSLRPGDLPGYTGWARPPFTLANSFLSSFQDEEGEEQTVMLGSNFTLTIHGPNSSNNINNNTYIALFYVRAYGPAVLAGRVVSSNNDDNENNNIKNNTTTASYKIEIGPLMDPGSYTLEVVLTFSHVPNNWITKLPLTQEPAYEGYKLERIPQSFRVVETQSAQALSNQLLDDNNNTKKKPLCQTQDIVSDDARWKVVHRNVEEKPPALNDYYISAWYHPNFTLQAYQNGSQSLGVAMDYRYNKDCRLLSLSEASQHQLFRLARRSSTLNGTFHLVIVGDSNLKAQSDLLRKVFLARPLKITRISTNRGLVRVWPQLQAQVANLTAGSNTSDNYMILFGAAMHEIYRLCTPDCQPERLVYLNDTQLAMPCVDLYQEYLHKLVDLLRTLDPVLLVFQTSTVRGHARLRACPDACCNNSCNLTLIDIILSSLGWLAQVGKLWSQLASDAPPRPRYQHTYDSSLEPSGPTSHARKWYSCVGCFRNDPGTTRSP